MKTKTFSMPDLILLVGTRVALGVGIGLLLAGRLDQKMRMGAGAALAAVGVVTTVPLVLKLIGSPESTQSKRDGTAPVGEQAVQQESLAV